MFGLHKKIVPKESCEYIVKFINIFLNWCLPYELLDKFLIRYNHLGVTRKNFDSVVSKIENNELNSITELEHKTLMFYFAILLYCVEYAVKRFPGEDDYVEISNRVKELLLSNYILKVLHNRFLNNVESIELYFINYRGLVLLGIEPVDYVTKSNEEFMQMLGVE